MDSLGSVTDGVYDYKGKTFEHDIYLKPTTIVNPKFIRFFKCTFKKPLSINDLDCEKISVSFSDCIFEDEISIYSSDFKELKFSGFRIDKDIQIEWCTMEIFKFNNGSSVGGDFLMYESVVKHEFDCSRLEKFSGKFTANINQYQEGRIEGLRSSFRKSVFNELELAGYFGAVNFDETEIKQNALFSEVIFNKSYFNKALFGTDTKFNSCVFEFLTSFKDSVSIGSISFEICTFKGQSFFTKAKFNKLSISDTSFEERASFDKLEVNIIKLYLTVFQKITFFDELKINKLLKNDNGTIASADDARDWRRTLRYIKQEFQKADNRIDYNRFRAYEMDAYYRQLRWDWREEFRDKFILAATYVVTGFDHSWRRALIFTLTAAALFYSAFYISENYMQTFAISQWQQFASGYFRFLLVTDFYNPLADGRSYIDNTNTIGWFIFILGKIFIAFGIYEMIQAFRKFKA